MPAGDARPGTPDRNVFAELAWTPKAAWGGFHAAAEAVHTGRLFVNDLNDDKAPAATVLNLRAGLSQQSGAWRFTQLVRLDNATDRRYAGSVIVKDAPAGELTLSRVKQTTVPGWKRPTKKPKG